MQTQTNEPKKRGGRRENAGGRPLKNPEKGKRVKRAITLRADHDEKLMTNRSQTIEAALDIYFSSFAELPALHSAAPSGIVEGGR
jgi:hypothetical protein